MNRTPAEILANVRTELGRMIDMLQLHDIGRKRAAAILARDVYQPLVAIAESADGLLEPEGAGREAQVQAQHDETGRMWDGPRKDIPPGFSEIPAPPAVPAPAKVEAIPSVVKSTETRRWKRLRGTTGAICYTTVYGHTRAFHHPDACVCQGTDPVPHCHRDEPDTHPCARCSECKEYRPKFPDLVGLLEPEGEGRACLERGPNGYRCTRPPAHQGNHVARNTLGEICESWTPASPAAPAAAPLSLMDEINQRMAAPASDGEAQQVTLEDLISEINQPMWRAAALARLDDLRELAASRAASLRAEIERLKRERARLGAEIERLDTALAARAEPEVDREARGVLERLLGWLPLVSTRLIQHGGGTMSCQSEADDFARWIRGYLARAEDADRAARKRGEA